MDSKEILKAIDPKGAEIEKLRAELAVMQQRDARVRMELQEAVEERRKLRWLKEHGILVETPDGMRYLKEEEFDEFFSNLPDFGGIAKRLAESMQHTKDVIAANILNKVFEETYADHGKHVALHLEKAKELTNGTNTREKGKRSRNKNP